MEASESGSYGHIPLLNAYSQEPELYLLLSLPIPKYCVLLITIGGRSVAGRRGVSGIGSFALFAASQMHVLCQFSVGLEPTMKRRVEYFAPTNSLLSGVPSRIRRGFHPRCRLPHRHGYSRLRYVPKKEGGRGGEEVGVEGD